MRIDKNKNKKYSQIVTILPIFLHVCIQFLPKRARLEDIGIFNKKRGNEKVNKK